MKFTTTYNIGWRPGVGKFPRTWMEYPGTNNIDSVYRYFDDKIKRWDWDVCGDETHDFVFEDGSAFRLEYSWWTDVWASEEEGQMKDAVHVQEISIDEANVPDKKPRRDWL